jgi:hypothetical protein
VLSLGSRHRPHRGAALTARASLPAKGGQQFRLGELEEPLLPFRADLDKGDVCEAGVGVGTGRLQVGPEIRAARHLVCDLFRPWARKGEDREVTVVPTIHLSAVLRAEDRDGAYAGLVSDLCVAAAALPGHQAG